MSKLTKRANSYGRTDGPTQIIEKLRLKRKKYFFLRKIIFSIFSLFVIVFVCNIIRDGYVILLNQKKKKRKYLE